MDVQKEIIEGMVMHQRNFQAFSGLCTISNRFLALAGFGLVFSGSGRVQA